MSEEITDINDGVMPRPPKIRKPKINKTCAVGDLVAIDIEDHAQGSEHIEFTIYGKVFAVDRRKVVVASWHYNNSYAEDDNCTTYTLLKAAITRLHIFPPIPTSNEPNKNV